MDLKPYYDFRDSLADFLEVEMTGPRHDDATRRQEIIDNWPLTRYSVGILYPRQNGELSLWDADQTEEVNDEDSENGEAETPVALANLRYPSSMGCSFAVDQEVSPSIVIRVLAAHYHNTQPGDAVVEEEQEDEASKEPAFRSYGRKPGLWQRIPYEIQPITLDVTRIHQGTHPDFRAEGLSLFYRVRATNQGCRAVTVILVNEQNQPQNDRRDSYAVFNAQLEITAPNPELEVFVERPARGAGGSDEELHSARLLYRHAREFATGHGIAVEWDKVDEDSERATTIRTQWSPRFEVLSADANPGIDFPVLSLKTLATGRQDEIVAGLTSFCDAYSNWLTLQENSIPVLKLSTDLEATAGEHLKTCRAVAQRMKSGIDVLQTDPLSWQAWQLANQAMLRNRSRSDWLKKGSPVGGPNEDAPDLAWRPFQLGFILLCLESLSNPESDARQIADLLWFPTGGGKTEAYLGLIAFCVMRRRLQHKDDGAGVTALMRYTLRLLTLQQFERAALIICCLESLRRENPTQLGKEPISIGLWLGSAATPNTLEEARQAIKILREKGDLDNYYMDLGNPVQLRNCVWCGAPLDPFNYSPTEKQPKRLIVLCKQHDQCAFHDGLPVHLIDSDVYQARPTLLIATVDKFANMPWRGEEISSLFGFKTSTHGAVPPPELIIQDELHLISGPLGTMVGLYETALDLICEQRGVRPKIVASTATIRRAKDQGRFLFNRKVEQFPPPALDARDSYFARQAKQDKKASRCYLGIMANGLSNANSTNRIYATLLQGAAQLAADNPEYKNPYWTLVGYFNSLRVLGATLLQVADIVPEFMQTLAAEGGQPVRELPDELRIEMNSTVKSVEVPKYLKRMEHAYPGTRDRAPLDVILATNMISVGVDIDRFGLMSVLGQPQSTSEYIQATSRVGRKYPGLVVIQFNPARSRDRSHYESFASYHSALYRQVEAPSVTPFSARARDRGLHAVLIALARQKVAGLRNNEDAEKMKDTLFDGPIQTVIDDITKRVREVAGNDEADATRRHLTDIARAWKRRAEDEHVKYNSKLASDSLLRDASEPNLERTDCFPTLRSLRDVDSETNLFYTRIYND